MMKITFIFHSSFAVELSRNILVFDYYGEGRLPDFPKQKKLWFLNSHNHQDHFRREILDLKEIHPEAEYVLSSDIRLRPEEEKEWIHRIRAGQTCRIGELAVTTLRSTDAGVAFLVEAEGVRLYHAGDLNWWHWEGEDKAWNHNMAANYRREINKIEGEAFDAAFIPLDPRLGEAFFWGMKYFLEHSRCREVFPMHCWGDYSVCGRVRLQPEMDGLLEHFHPIEKEGQEWKLCL